MNTQIKYADLFAGCGGLSYGFHRNSRYQHVIATDIWGQARETYLRNFNDANYVLADLSIESHVDLIVSQLGSDLDLLIGGPPCKGFSTLNNSKVISKYNTLVDQYLTIVERASPNIFIIENVRGFTSKVHPSGLHYPDHVKNRVAQFNCKYYISDLILNAGDYGVAQNRIRYFMIGVKENFDSERVVIKRFIQGLISRRSQKKLVLRDVIGDLPKVAVRQGSDKMELDNGTIIYNHKSMNHSVKLEERFKCVPENGGLMDVPYHLLTTHLKKVVDGGYGSGGFSKNIYGRMDWNKPSGTIVAGMDKITIGRFLHPDENRLLTPRECARIQSFPDDFVFTGSMVSQYYQIGNAVPPRISELFSDLIMDIMTTKVESTSEELVWN